MPHFPLRFTCTPRSVLAKARDLEPSLHLTYLPECRTWTTAKILTSFAQIVSASPYVMDVEPPGQLSTLLDALGVVNFSAPKVSCRGSSLELIKRGGLVVTLDGTHR